MLRPNTPLPLLFEDQVKRTPALPAVAAGDDELTYAELNDRANRLASYLVGCGVGPEDVVAVALPSSARLVVALLAVLKAGAAYLPVDLGLPDERIGLLIAKVGAAVAVTADGSTAFVQTQRLHRVCLDDPVTRRAIAARPAANLTDADRRSALTPRHAAFIIYTSGSTGRPKGVVVEHRSLTDYLRWTTAAYRGARRVSLVPTSVAFDLTVTGLYTPLLVGGCVRLVSFPNHDPADVKGLQRAPCTFLKATPSHLSLLSALPDEFAPTEELLLGGEALLSSAVDDWRRRHPDVDVLNVYGPTEATVNCAEYRIPPGAALPPGRVPIGRAQPGVRLYVLDTGLRKVDQGTTGELFVAGTALARGYLGLPALTADRFLPDPFGPPGERMYRTGDLVRADHEGNLVFVGRVDGQVKIRGHRVELGEVEAALALRPELAAVACAVRGEPGATELVAYVVGRQPGVVQGAELRRHVGRLLPRYMVPAAVVEVQRLPLTPNGKVDRAALSALRDPDRPADGVGLVAAAGVAEVVTLRPGEDDESLFCLHSDVGYSTPYEALAPLLPGKAAVYAVPAGWLAPGEQSPATFDDLVGRYLGIVRQARPRGRYHLLGAEIGGLLAYALAARLRADGAEVGRLVLVDASLGMPGSQQDADARFRGALASLRASMRRQLTMDEMAGASRVWRDCRWLSSGFRPVPWAGDLLLVASESDNLASSGWRPWVSGQVTTLRVDARPGTFTHPDVVGRWGLLVADELAGDRTGAG